MSLPTYVLPTTEGLPGGLTLNEFMHNVIVGISGYNGKLVRPSYQIEPPTPPAINIDWIAYSVQKSKPDTYAYTFLDEGGVYRIQRQQKVEIQLMFYGPNGGENIDAFADGLLIPRNLSALKEAQIGYTDVSEINLVPDLVNERWRQRWIMSVFVMRQIRRTYPIVSFASAEGIIHTVLDGVEDNTAWSTEDHR